MAFPTLSQTISTPRVQTIVNAKGDTLIQMSLADAKIILVTVFDKQIADSLIDVYERRDSLSTSSITLLKSDVDKLRTKNNNLEKMILNDTSIIANKDTEINLHLETIKQQKKEIRKQKVLKVIGWTAAVVLPITTIILMAK
jgi:ADP-dependent phosphofructokinase/glucokinase